MRIGLISDTRISTGEDIPQQVFHALQGVDLILHAGGINTSSVLDRLESIAPVKAAGRLHGRHVESRQPISIEGGSDSRVAEQQVLKAEGHTIGLVNELWFEPLSDEVLPGIIEAHKIPAQTLPKLIEGVFGTAVDIVVFGRTLHAMVEEHQGILFVNPGSPSLPKSLRRLGNVAILNLTSGAREAEIIDLAAFSGT